MATVTPPRAGIPIGYVMVGGNRVPVTVDSEYLRFFSTLTDRAGGITGPGTIDLTVSQFEDAGIAEQQAEFYNFVTASQQAPTPQPNITDVDTPIDSTRDELAALRQRVEALEQGLVP